jgi:CRISPR/Cas system CSM-associated protein Csm4 (group 5 of RAMP superfamily)
MRIEVFSAIIFVISRLYGHTTGLILNNKIKTKSQKIEGTVLYYPGLKYLNTKINLKSYEHLKFFSAIIFVISRLYGHTTGLILNTKIKTKSQKLSGLSSIT